MNENKIALENISDVINMHMDDVFSMVTTYIYEERNCDFYSDDTVRRMNSIESRIDQNAYLDKDFKVQFSNDFNTTVNMAASDAFENGLRVGLGLLKCLLGADVPKIIVEQAEPEKRPARITPIYRDDKNFTDYMSWAAIRLTDEEKGQIESKVQYFIMKHREKSSSLF